MAIFRFKITRRSRVLGSQSATAVVQYLTRDGRYAVFPEDDVRYLTRTSEATHERGDLRHVEVGNLPGWAHGDATVFFEAAYQHEGANRSYATALQMALPRELTHEQHLALARDFVETHLHDKPYLVVKHEPLAKDGQPQPHLHILLSERTMDAHDRAATQFFKRYNREHPERGGAQKDPWWIERRAPGKLRESWAILTNVHLEQAGVEARVDPRELAVQGIQRRPGGKWHRSPEPRDMGQEQAAAGAWWKGKQREVGLTEENRILAVRTYARQGAPGHYPTHTDLAHVLTQLETRHHLFQREAHQLTQHGARLHAALMREQDYARTGARRSAAAEQHVTTLLAQGQALGLGDETPVGGGLEVRLAGKKRGIER